MIDCPFCARIRDGDYDTTGWSDVVSFVPLNPVTTGHRLFVPHSHVGNALNDPHLTGRVFAAAAAWAARRTYECNLITSAGSNATQTVFHLHAHVVPRHQGDGLHLPWTGQRR